MTTVSEILGINYIVIAPTLALLLTVIVLLFCTITISTPMYVKKYVSFAGILLTLFTIFLKFGLFLTDGVSSYFSEKILLDEFALVGNVAGLNRGDQLSNEASLKYFLLGSLASCIFVYGIALIYVSLSIIGVYEISFAISIIGPENVPLTTFVGLILIIVGLLFKVAAAPFQAWAPDVYQGSPTGYVGYMATVAKAASFIVLARLVAVSLTFIIDQFDLFFSAVVIMSVLAGALFAANQSDLKRLIAYSGVIQSGFILSGISSGVYGISASTFYLITYIIQLIGISINEWICFKVYLNY